MSAPKVFCYVSSWARDRPGRGRFTPADLDPSLCTHVVWAFAKIINGGVELPSPDQDQRDEDSDYQQLLRLREANPKLKVTKEMWAVWIVVDVRVEWCGYVLLFKFVLLFLRRDV